MYVPVLEHNAERIVPVLMSAHSSLDMQALCMCNDLRAGAVSIVHGPIVSDKGTNFVIKIWVYYSL